MIITIDAKNIFLQNLISVSGSWRLSEDINFLIMIKICTLHSQSQHVYTIYISIKFKDSIWIYDFVIHTHTNTQKQGTHSARHI